MTSRYTRKGIFTGISVATLLATAIGMPDTAVRDSSLDSSSKTAKPQKSADDQKLALEDLGHDDLVLQLANENFFIREKASKLIWRRGKSTLNALEDALLTKNPEIISRSTELIRYIKVGISPDTPPQVTKLIEAFEDADIEGKQNILRELYAEKAYSQMLFMLAEMKDQAQAMELYEDFNRLGHQAAKESIGKGDIEAAIEQLKLVPRSETSLRSLAYLYALTGRLDAEIEKLKTQDAQLIDKEWEQYLHLEKTNREDIRKFAQRENLIEVIGSLNLLEGDPTMTYDYYSNKAPLAAKTGMAILKAQYNGESQDFIERAHNQQKHVLDISKNNDVSEIVNQTIKSLCLTGAGHLIEPYMLKNYIYESFSFLEHREQGKKALETIGITDSPSLEKFIKETTRLAIDELEIDQEEMNEFRGEEQIPYSSRLILVAEFYYNRGLLKTAKKIVTPLLKEFEKQENPEWYRVVETIANHRMHDLAIEVILERGDGDNTYQQAVTYLYDDTSETDLIWNTLLKRDNVSPEKSFRDLAVIMGVYQEEIKTYLQLQDELIKIATKQGVVSLKTMQSALLSAATFRQDAISGVRFAKQLLDTEEDKLSIPLRKLEYLQELSNNLDWKGICELLDKDTSFIHNSARWYAVYSIAKRNLGDVNNADRILEHAKLVSLGLADELRDIAYEHYLAGYYDISTQIIERILIISSVSRESNLYQFAFSFLSGSDNAYTNTQQWGKAAAFLMVRIASDIVEHPSSIETSNTSFYINNYYNAQFTRGMELYQKGEKAKGLKMLKASHESIIGDGTLADHFYPAIKSTDLDIEFNLWLNESKVYLERSIAEFPESANTHNTLAWILARAVRDIDAGIKHSEIAIRLTPFEAAYIDTMGELYHSKGDRKNAIKWGEEAVLASKYGRLDAFGTNLSAKMRTQSLTIQLERFKAEPHPKP